MFELKPIKYPLFPSLIYHTPFLTKYESEMYVKCLDNLEKKSIPFVQKPFYQTTDKLHLLNDKWKELNNKVIKVIDSIADDQYIIRDSFYTTCMWANISTGKEYFHKTHSHPNSFFSSIIYHRGNESSETTFHDPRAQANVFKPSISENLLFNSSTFKLPFIEGSMVIFPSWLPHTVIGEGKDNSNRITISCNFMLHSEINQHAGYLKI